MPGVSFVSYDYDDADARAFFEYAGYKARRPSEPLHDAGDAILRTVAEAFETEGGAIGRSWEDLTDRYKEDKQEEWGFVYPILVASADLYLDATGDRAIKVGYHPQGGGYVEYRVRDRKASYHQQPDGPGTGKMPHRPFYAMTPELRAEIDEAFRDWLDDIKAANRRRRTMGGVNPLSRV